MRKFILIAALVLVSVNAQAGMTRGLTLASSDAPATVEQSQAAKAGDASKFAGRQRPSIQQQGSQTPQQGSQRMQRPGPVTAAKYAVAVKVEQLKRKGAATLARVRYALHRHGVYW